MLPLQPPSTTYTSSSELVAMRSYLLFHLLPIRQVKFDFNFEGQSELLASHLRSQKALLGLVQWRPGEDTCVFLKGQSMISMHWLLRLREDYCKHLEAQEQRQKRRGHDTSDRSRRFLILKNFGDMEGSTHMVLDKCCEYTASPKLSSGSTEATGHGASSSSGDPKQSWYLVRRPGP